MVPPLILRVELFKTEVIFERRAPQLPGAARRAAGGARPVRGKAGEGTSPGLPPPRARLEGAPAGLASPARPLRLWRLHLRIGRHPRPLASGAPGAESLGEGPWEMQGCLSRSRAFGGREGRSAQPPPHQRTQHRRGGRRKTGILLSVTSHLNIMAH